MAPPRGTGNGGAGDRGVSLELESKAGEGTGCGSGDPSHLRLASGLSEALPGFETVEDLLDLHADHELNVGAVLPHAAMPHLADHPAILKLDVHDGAGRMIARADVTEPAFGNIHHSPGFAIGMDATNGADLDGHVRGEAHVAALFEPAHRATGVANIHPLHDRMF